MVKENGMVMMTEEEYKNLISKTHQLDCELDLAKMELATYRKAMEKLANKKLNKRKSKKNKKTYGIEIPAGDFADMIDKATLDWMEDADGNMDEEKLNKLEETDVWFVWNGFSARIPYGCEICNEVLPAIKAAYEEYNS